MLLMLLTTLGCRKDAPNDTATLLDVDGDGYFEDEDCDDTDPSVNPGAIEVCNDIDDDCSGAPDDAVGGLWYTDADGDGYGDPTTETQACDADGQVADSSDCDDTDPAINVAADEVCDGVDNNCDGDIDDDAIDAPDWYADADADGYGDPQDVTRACEAPSGTVANDEDCDDTLPEVNPEVWWYADADTDTYGNPDVAVQDCEAPQGFVADDTDCDDSEASVFPGNAEVCDDLDNDCNASVDDGVLETFYRDADGDGYGDPSVTTLACDAPSGFADDATDCDDLDADNWPGNSEVCDDGDNDCDSDVDEGVLETWYVDDDGDGYGSDDTEIEACSAPSSLYVADGGDCDDDDTAYNPGATLGCDGNDYDCDGSVDNDGDGDGYADASCGGDDCDDTLSSVGPCANCEDWYSFGNTTDGVYDIDPSASGTSYEVYCDMNSDGGGWTLVFSSPADNTTYGSSWDYWWTSGGTTSITATTDTGKSDAYDEVEFDEIRLTASYDSSSIYASTGTTYTGLPSLVGSEITTCSGLTGTARYQFTATTTRSGSYFQNDYIGIVACDTDGSDLEQNSHYDAAVFTTYLNHGDYNYANGDIGSEFRVGGYTGSTYASSSNVLSVWVR